MFDFNNQLIEEETILYEGKPILGKTDKNILGELVVIGFILIIQILLVWSVVTKTGDGANGINLSFIIIFLTTLLFASLVVYNIIYKLFIKDKKIAKHQYCITNKRAIKYDGKNNELIFGNLSNYEFIEVQNEKNNHGDLYMGVLINENVNSNTDTLIEIKNILLNKNPNDAPFIIFESIKNPYQVLNIVENARNSLNK